VAEGAGLSVIAGHLTESCPHHYVSGPKDVIDVGTMLFRCYLCGDELTNTELAVMFRTPALRVLGLEAAPGG
jgi:hypothetical protein